MKVSHEGEKTALVETDQAHKSGLPVAVIASARRKLRFMRHAVDERDLRVMKSLHFEKLKGARNGQCSIRLNDQWRIVFKINQQNEQREIEILSIEDYH